MSLREIRVVKGLVEFFPQCSKHHTNTRLSPITLSSLVDSETWMPWMATGNQITPRDMWGQNMDVSLTDGTGAITAISSLVINCDEGRRYLETFTALNEFAIQCLGCGATRNTEASNLATQQIRWDDNFHHMEYKPLSSKVGRYDSRSSSCQLKLPADVSRAILLGRYLTIKIGGGCPPHRRLFPVFRRRAVEAPQILKQIMELNKAPKKCALRQFLTSMLNVVFPSKEAQVAMGVAMGSSEDPAVLSADTVAARRANHSERTHAEHYSTAVAGSADSLWRKWHHALGGGAAPIVDGVYRPVVLHSDKSLLRCLRTLYGEAANFRSDLQRVALLSYNNRSEHKLVILPMGGGKTFLVMAAIIRDYLCSSRPRCSILVVPNVSLVGDLRTRCQALLDGVEQERFSVVGLTQRDVQTRYLPGCLSASRLPDMLIVSIEALDLLLLHHLDELQALARADRFEGVWVDEIDLLTDATYREPMSCLRKITSLGVQVTVMTGTATAAMGRQLASYCGLTRGEGGREVGLDVIHGANPFGSHFHLLVHKVPDVVAEAAEIAVRYVRNQGRSIHLVCALKQECNQIYDAILRQARELSESILVVTGDMESQAKIDASSQWASGGRARIMLSTSALLRGAENRNLGAVVAVRTIFNLLNFAQLIGRLRSDLAGDGALVVQLVGDGNDGGGGKLSWGERDEPAKLNELSELGIIEDANSEDVKNLLTIGAYRSQVVDNQRCILEALSSTLGYHLGSPCGKCSSCRPELTPFRWLEGKQLLQLHANSADRVQASASSPTSSLLRSPPRRDRTVSHAFQLAGVLEGSAADYGLGYGNPILNTRQPPSLLSALTVGDDRSKPNEVDETSPTPRILFPGDVQNQEGVLFPHAPTQLLGVDASLGATDGDVGGGEGGRRESGGEYPRVKQGGPFFCFLLTTKPSKTLFHSCVRSIVTTQCSTILHWWLPTTQKQARRHVPVRLLRPPALNRGPGITN